jgi:hypothetical protein
VLLGRCCYYMGSSLSVAVQQSSLVMLLELGVSRELGSLQTLLCRLGQKSELEVLG